MTLTTKARAYLRGLAHNLDPVVRIGRGGVSDAVVSETTRALETHELIKVRIEADEGTERKRMAEELASRTQSHLAGTVGKIAMLYRERAQDPTIRLPR